MKKIFLTSKLGCEEKINNKVISKPIDNVNGIINNIKEKLIKEDNFVFITSSPKDYENNDLYAKVTFESFNKSGFNFKNLIIIDNRYKGNLKETINDSDVVLLAGGHTLTEMQYFEEINLRDILKDYNKVIIGQSAGSLNLAEMVVCSPEFIEEIGSSYIWKGLSLTDINIEPHFITGKLKEEELLLREELLKLSEKYLLYALVDGSYIYDNGSSQTLYGEGYTIYKREIKKICNKERYIEINN